MIIRVTSQPNKYRLIAMDVVLLFSSSNAVTGIVLNILILTWAIVISPNYTFLELFPIPFLRENKLEFVYRKVSFIFLIEMIFVLFFSPSFQRSPKEHGILTNADLFAFCNVYKHVLLSAIGQLSLFRSGSNKCEFEVELFSLTWTTA